MSKKTRSKKMKLGKKLKQNRRIPHIARLRTHGKVQFNIHKRDWRRQKMRLED